MHSSWENKLVNLPSSWGTIWTKPYCRFQIPAHLVSLLHWWHSSLLSYVLLTRKSTQFWPWWVSELGTSLKGLCRPRGLFFIGSESRASGAGRAWGMCELQVLLLACAYLAVGSSDCSENSLFSISGMWAELLDPSQEISLLTALLGTGGRACNRRN